MADRRSLPIHQYHVGVICALSHEMKAVRAMLEIEDEPLKSEDKGAHDSNTYVLGRMSGHYVVVACLPEGVYGTVSAASVAKDMLRTFTNLRFGLLVGIGGGIPNLQEYDMRLGDIVVSKPHGMYGGVVQYDLGKNLGEGSFKRKGSLNSPPISLLTAMSALRSDLRDCPIPQYLREMVQKWPSLGNKGYTYPGANMDKLLCSQCDHNQICEICSDGKALRPCRNDENPEIHYGIIASGNQVIKNAADRDQLGRELNAICVEMEAAGLMNNFPCLVVRGICDYADSQKNDAWQNYAATTAAAYAKWFLSYITPEATTDERPAREVIDILTDNVKVNKAILSETKKQDLKADNCYQDSQDRDCHQTLKTSTYEQFKNFNPPRVDGTCGWVLSHPQYRKWRSSTHDDLLWVSADPGCGKSVLSKSLIDNELRSNDGHAICYFFFKDNQEQDSLTTALCALLHQLFSQQYWLLHHAIPAWRKNGNKLVDEIQELWRILLAATSDSKAYDVTCVLDALDECRPSDQKTLIDMLATFHNQASGTRPGRLKFLITSRPYADIQIDFKKAFNNLPSIRLRGEENNDQIHKEINLVIEIRVNQLARELELESDMREQLKAKLLEMKQRTYLWLHLALGSIRQTLQNSLRPDERRIDWLPSSVEDAYEKILSRVDETENEKVKRILRIVVGARRPLAVGEMGIALGLASSECPNSLEKARLSTKWLVDKISQWCGLFIFINHQKIYLIHQTAKEFLTCRDGYSASLCTWKHCLVPRRIEEEMATICVTFLCLEEDIRQTAESFVRKFKPHKRLDSFLDENNHVECFLVYSALYWPSHYRDVDVSTNSSVEEKVRKLYTIGSSTFDIWFPIFRRENSQSYVKLSELHYIHLAAILGHEKLILSYLQSQERDKINETSHVMRTALAWASAFGYDKVVQIILKKGAEMEAGEPFKKPLILASKYGYEKVVQILLEYGANIHVREPYFTPLLEASLYGHEKVVQVLLEYGAKVNTGGPFLTPLQEASAYGYRKIVQMLLKHGANINIGGPINTPLQRALRSGDEKVVQILLQNRANVTIGDKYYTALEISSTRGYEIIAQLLVKHGTNVNIEEVDTLLQLESENGHESVVQIHHN